MYKIRDKNLNNNFKKCSLVLFSQFSEKIIHLNIDFEVVLDIGVQGQVYSSNFAKLALLFLKFCSFKRFHTILISFTNNLFFSSTSPNFKTERDIYQNEVNGDNV